MANSVTQPDTFRYFRWRTARFKSPDKHYQYRARVTEPRNSSTRLEYANGLLTAVAIPVQPRTVLQGSGNKTTATVKEVVSPARRHTATNGEADFTVIAQAIPIKPRSISRPRSAPPSAVTSARYKKAVIEKPFPYPSPRAVAGILPAFRQRLTELARLEQETILAEEARRRLFNRSLSTRQLGSSGCNNSTTSLRNQQRPKSGTTLTRPGRICTNPTTAGTKAGMNTCCKAGEKSAASQATSICKSMSCIEISGAASSPTAKRSTSDLDTPSQTTEQLSASTSSNPHSFPFSMSLPVLDEFLSDTVVESCTSISSSQQDTETCSSNSDSTLSSSTASAGELVMEPGLTEGQDSGVQLDVDTTQVNDDPESLSDDNSRSIRQLDEVYHINPTTDDPSTEDASTVPPVLSSSPTANPGLEKKVGKTTHPKRRRRRHSSASQNTRSNSHPGSKTLNRKASARSTTTKLRQKSKH